jgi:hypothetical protein
MKRWVSLSGGVMARYGPGALALALVAVSIGALLFPVLSQPERPMVGHDLHIHHNWEVHNRRALSAGQLPLWNPFVYGGFPAMADIFTELFYPPAMLLRWLPLGSFFSWGAFLHLWILGAGLYGLAREIGTSRLAATAGAIGLALCGSVMQRLFLGHVLVLHCYAWFPLALMLTIRSAGRHSMLPHAGLVLVLTMQLLTGFVQGTIYTLAGMAAYAIFVALWPPATGPVRPRYRPLLQCALAVSLAVGLAAFQLLPWARLVADSGRQSGVDWGTATEGSLGVRHLSAILFPGALGALREWEGYLFVTVGLVAFVPLAWQARRHRRIVWFLVVLSVAALVLAAGSNLPFYRLHHLLFPQLRIPTRLVFFWSVGVAALGAIGLDSFLSRTNDADRRRRRWMAYLPGLLALSAGAGALVIERSTDWGPDVATLFGSPRWLVLLTVVALAVSGVAARSRPRVAGVLIVALIAVEGIVLGRPLVNPDHAIVQSYSVIEAIAGLGPARVASLCEDRVAASALAAAAIATPDGFGSLLPARYMSYLGLVSRGVARASPTRLASATQLPLRPDLMDYLNVTHLVTCLPVDIPRLRLLDEVDGVYLYENLEAWPRAVLTCDTEPQAADEVARRLEAWRYDDGVLRPVPPRIGIRWTVATTEEVRRVAERRYRLAQPEREADARTWRYDLLDTSGANRIALVADPAVEDTAGILRQTGELVPRENATIAAGLTGDSYIVGGSACSSGATVTTHLADTPRGELRVTVETGSGGRLFLSEAYYPERRAWVDGRETVVEPINLAFSSIPIEPGRHVVELRFVPTTLYWGVAVSLTTAVVWAAACCVRRRRKTATGG